MRLLCNLLTVMIYFFCIIVLCIRMDLYIMALAGYPPFLPTLPDPQYLTINEVRNSSTVFTTVFGNSGVDFSVNGSYSDAQIDSLITQASRMIDGYIKGSLTETVRQEYLIGTGSNFLQLRYRPIWRGVYMTLTDPAPMGDTSIIVDDLIGVRAGQFLVFPSNPDYPIVQPIGSDPYALQGPSVANSFEAATGPGTIPLNFALTKDHIVGEPVIISGVDTVALLLPYSVYPIPTNVMTIRYAQAQLQIWTPLNIQLFGVVSVFPRDVPLMVQYTSGFTPPYFPAPIKQACLQCMLYLSTSYRYEGVKRIKSDERSLEFGNQLPALPDAIKETLSAYRQSVGFK